MKILFKKMKINRGDIKHKLNSPSTFSYIRSKTDTDLYNCTELVTWCIIFYVEMVFCEQCVASRTENELV